MSYPSAEAALKGIGNGEYYGAIVIPADYSKRIADIASPPTIPIAVANEDEGAEMGGRQVNLDEQVAAKITSPTSPAPDFVKWTTLESREAALEGIEKGKLYAAVVILRDYSERFAAMSGPPAGTTAIPFTTSPVGGQLPAPEPAEVELLTSPAARPSTTALIENAFSGIVGGISGATSERISEQAGKRGAQLPPEVAAVVGDPVRADVTEAQPVGPDSGNGRRRSSSPSWRASRASSGLRPSTSASSMRRRG